MKVYAQSEIAFIPVYLALDSDGHTPVVGKTYLDFTVKYSKEGSSSFTTKVLASGDVIEIGNGVYRIKFTITEMNTVGYMLLNVAVAGARTINDVIEVSRVAHTDMVSKGLDWDAEVSAEVAHRSAIQQISINGVFYNIVDKAVLYSQSLLTPSFFKRNEFGVKFVVTISGLDYNPTGGLVTFTFRRQDDPIKRKAAKVDSVVGDIQNIVLLSTGLYQADLVYTFAEGDLSDIGDYFGEFRLLTTGRVDYFPNEAGGFPIKVIESV